MTRMKTTAKGKSKAPNGRVRVNFSPELAQWLEEQRQEIGLTKLADVVVYLVVEARKKDQQKLKLAA